MSKKINVVSTTTNIECASDSFFCYQNLKTVFDENKIFLLESLAGPEKECNQSIIGYNPILSLSQRGHTLIFHGNQALIDIIMAMPEWEAYPKTINAVIFNDGKFIFKALREIESNFQIEYKGNNTGICFGYFGYIGYDAIFAIEDIDKKIDRLNACDEVCLSIFEGILNINLVSKSTSLTINQCDLYENTPKDRILSALNNTKKQNIDAIDNISFDYLSTPSVDKKTYFSWVEKAKHHISIGDIYQIQLGHEIKIDSDIPPFINS